MSKKRVNSLVISFILLIGSTGVMTQSAYAVTFSDNSTVSLVSMSSTMAGGGTCSTRTVISSSTRVRTIPDGENGEFDSATTNSFVWNSTHQSAFNTILARPSTTITNFSPTNGTTYTFYQLREGSTTAFYFCHAGQVDLLINGTNSISGWAVAGNIFFTSGEASGSQVNSTPQQGSGDLSAATLASARATAKRVLASQLGEGKGASLEQFLDAGYGVRNGMVAEKVSSAILKLPVSERDNSQKINEIIDLENFLDRISVSESRSTVSAGDLIAFNLMPADTPYKYSVVQGLSTYPNGSLNTLEKVAAAVKEQIAKAEAPKLRLAAIKAKMAARKK